VLERRRKERRVVLEGRSARVEEEGRKE